MARSHMSIYLGLPNYTNNLRRLGWTDDDFADGGSDRLVDAIVAWGDIDAVAAACRRTTTPAPTTCACRCIDADDQAASRSPAWRRPPLSSAEAAPRQRVRLAAAR